MLYKKRGISSVDYSIPITIGRVKVENLILNALKHFGGLAQLARAPALQAGGQRFESVILHNIVP